MKATLSFIFDKRKMKKNGTYPIKLRIYYTNNSKMYGLGRDIAVSEKDWEKIHSSHLRNKVLQKIKEHLDKEKAKALSLIDQLDDHFSFEMFEVLYLNKKMKEKENKYWLYSLYEENIDYLYKAGRIGTAKAYETAMKSLKLFAPHIEVHEVTPIFLKHYEQWMLENGNSLTTVGIYLRSLRIIMNTAKDYNLITKEMYPFGSRYRRKYEVPSGGNIKKALSIEDIRKIRDAECPNQESEFSRDIWMFAFYCNEMNMVDIFSLKYGDISDNYLHYMRKKTYRTIRDLIFLLTESTVTHMSVLMRYLSKIREQQRELLRV